MQVTFDICWNGTITTLKQLIRDGLEKATDNQYHDGEIIHVEVPKDQYSHIDKDFCYHRRITVICK